MLTLTDAHGTVPLGTSHITRTLKNLAMAR